MDLGTQTLLSVAVLLGLNNALVRMRALRHRTVLFWGVQVLNGLVALWLIVRGVPGLEDMPAIGWMLGLLLILHIVQNMRFQQHVRAEAAEADGHDARASAIRDVLDDQ